MSDKAGADTDQQPPLPKGWVRGFSKSQKRFYYSHIETKHTQWHFPTASEVADPLKGKKRAEEYQQYEQRKRGADELSTSTTSAKSGGKDSSSDKKSSKRPREANNNNDDVLALADTTCVAIIVPYRDIHPKQQRAKHLSQFVPHMLKFLNHLVGVGRLSDYHIYIVEQSDDGRKFNRGKLLNIGFDIARKKPAPHHDVFIFHDVDLLPQSDLYDAYSTFPKTPYHIARVWDRYSNNPKYFGGVVSFSSSDFKRINGYPNTFWGWGGEDDEMQLRCERLGMKWEHPTAGTLVDLEEMTLTEKLQFLRENKEWKCMVKWEALKEHATTWKTNGLADLSYKILKTASLDRAKNKATKITVDVKLNGNHWANDKCGVDFMGDWNK